MSRNCLIAFARHVKLIRAGNTKKQKRMPSLIYNNYNVSRLTRMFMLYNYTHNVVVVGSYSLPELTTVKNLLDCAVYSQL